MSDNTNLPGAQHRTRRPRFGYSWERENQARAYRSAWPYLRRFGYMPPPHTHQDPDELLARLDGIEARMDALEALSWQEPVP